MEVCLEEDQDDTVKIVPQPIQENEEESEDEDISCSYTDSEKL